MLTILKKNKLVVLVLVVYLSLFIVSPQKAIRSLDNSIYYLIEMFQILPVIFLFTVVIEALIPKEWIMKGLGEKSGIKGNLFSLLLGSVSAGPIYAAFPISKTLLKKGASVTNIVIILSSWAVIKVPMLANEVKFLGVKFMGLRWLFTVISIFIMAYLMGAFVKKKDMLETRAKEEESILSIKEEYCIGCGLCTKTLPNYYEMKNNKAIVKQIPKNKKEIEEAVVMVERCPVNAILYEDKGEVLW